jgi:hypothetical protein
MISIPWYVALLAIAAMLYMGFNLMYLQWAVKTLSKKAKKAAKAMRKKEEVLAKTGQVLKVTSQALFEETIYETTGRYQCSVDDALAPLRQSLFTIGSLLQEGRTPKVEIVEDEDEEVLSDG